MANSKVVVIVVRSAVTLGAVDHEVLDSDRLQFKHRDGYYHCN